MTGPADSPPPPQTRVSVRRVPGGQQDQRTEDLNRLNLLAQAARGRAHREATYRWIDAAARDAAREALTPTLGEVPEDLATRVGDAVLAAVLTAMREGPPAEDDPPPAAT